MDIDWPAVLGLSISPLELFVRGSAIYWFLFVAFRFVLKRDIGAIGIADVLLLVLVADAAQNAMAGEYRSVPDGFILISTILGWNLALDYAAFRFSALRRLIEPRAVPLIRDGRLMHRNLRREFLTSDELYAKLREKGAANIDDVAVAYMESDGEISVVKRKGAA